MPAVAVLTMVRACSGTLSRDGKDTGEGTADVTVTPGDATAPVSLSHSPSTSSPIAVQLPLTDARISTESSVLVDEISGKSAH